MGNLVCDEQGADAAANHVARSPLGAAARGEVRACETAARHPECTSCCCRSIFLPAGFHTTTGAQPCGRDSRHAAGQPHRPSELTPRSVSGGQRRRPHWSAIEATPREHAQVNRSNQSGAIAQQMRTAVSLFIFRRETEGRPHIGQPMSQPPHIPRFMAESRTCLAAERRATMPHANTPQLARPGHRCCQSLHRNLDLFDRHGRKAQPQERRFAAIETETTSALD